jgi:putative Mg2+ transporter-C (MgtC) family protein
MPPLQIVIEKLLLAVLIGGLIGAEREYRSKSAGFRTLTLICIGSTLFTIFSILIGSPGNPDRISSNIVTGIGFVGAGVIFKGDFGVNGITTAAIIWATAALGVGIGAGYEMISIIGCIVILLMLLIFSRFEDVIDRANQTRNYKIVCEYQNETLHRYEEYFKTYKLTFKRSRELKTDNMITGEWMVKGSETNHKHFVHFILNDPTVKVFEF